jgi:hypothetical protein
VEKMGKVVLTRIGFFDVKKWWRQGTAQQLSLLATLTCWKILWLR